MALKPFVCSMNGMIMVQGRVAEVARARSGPGDPPVGQRGDHPARRE